jgi:hypothetical protein
MRVIHLGERLGADRSHWMGEDGGRDEAQNLQQPADSPVSFVCEFVDEGRSPE